MPVGEASFDFNVVPGVRLAAVAAGLKPAGLDVVLMELAEGSTTAGVFTQSLFAAAPVQVSKRHLELAKPRYLLTTSANANAAVGDVGIADAIACCQNVSQRTGTAPEQVLPFSTGVIGERLRVDLITDAVPMLLEGLREDAWLEAATGIMTTDTRPKIATRQRSIDGRIVTLTGIAKGAGMIQPNMATMLTYSATDALVETAVLDRLLRAAVERSFNRITVDSDTSTNDCCTLSATGVSGVRIDASGTAFDAFSEMLDEVFTELAQGIIRDAEGATKFVSVVVENGPSVEVCLAVAYAIANSPLMKTAIYASDANWGRIVMAIGKSGVDIDIDKLGIFLGDVCLMSSGQKDDGYTEGKGAEVMSHEEITIRVSLGDGDVTETVWTSDLSHDYVRINAEYRT